MNLGGGFLFLFDTIVDLYLSIVIARFVLQMVRADFYNPLSQLIVKATSPLLMPFRKIVPGFGGVDIACIVLFLVLVLIKLILIGFLFGVELFLTSALVYLFFLAAVNAVLNFFFFVIIINFILSWVQPGGYHPIANAIVQMASPLLTPARRFIPPLGMLDISPMVVILLIYFTKIIFRLDTTDKIIASFF